MKVGNAHYRTAKDIPSTVPVFPLTGALLLPEGRLPLNIFEPRYLAMIDEAIGGKRLIGMIQPALNGSRRADLARVREALKVEVKPPSVDAEATPSAMQQAPVFVCHHCGRALLVVQTILRGDVIRGPPAS